MAAYNLVKTVATGDIISASDRNTEHQNHINNNTVTGVTGDSGTVVAMQTTVDPGESGTESLATDIKGEFERIRFAIVDLKGTTYWYQTPTKTLAQMMPLSGGTFTGTVTMSGANIDMNTTNLVKNWTLTKYRRPVLQYNSATVVNVETGLDGTSGDCLFVFPDGDVRTDSDTTRIRCNLAQNAVFNNATRANNICGLRTGSQTANTWYAIYDVKVTAGSGAATDLVAVADTVMPTQANYATLNSNFGTNGWGYLGLVANGDKSGATNVVLKFVQAGNMTLFYNATTGNSVTGRGIRLVTTASGTSLTFTYAAGTNIGTPQLANTISHVFYQVAWGSSASTLAVLNSGGTYTVDQRITASGAATSVAGIFLPAAEGLQTTLGGSTTGDLFMYGFVDGALGVASNPLL